MTITAPQRFRPGNQTTEVTGGALISRGTGDRQQSLGRDPALRLLDALGNQFGQLGAAAIHAGLKVRYFAAADLVETLYRGLADNTVGKIIESLLRVDLIILDELGFAPLDDTGTQLLFRLVAGAYERRSLAIGSHWPFEQWGRFLPEQTTAVSILDRLLHHATVVITGGQSYRMKDAQHRKGNT